MCKLNISLNPSYYCNFRCPFCYLTEEQLGDKSRLLLEHLDMLLGKLNRECVFGTLDLYGGEPMMLPTKYLDDLKWVLQSNGFNEVNVVTNLSVDNPAIHDDYFYITVSYDFDAREKRDEVFSRMLTLTRPFSILILCTPELVKSDVDQCIRELNILSMLNTVEIKPYSPNQANQLDVTNEDFEDVVKRFIDSGVEKNFNLTNEDLLEEVITGKKNAFSDDHIYITPKGKIAVLDFDENNNEKFVELGDFDEYRRWCRMEKKRVRECIQCSECEYVGKCLSEHLRPVREDERSCNGYIKLINWYKEG